MTKVIGVELSHHDAPIHIREGVALNKDQAIESIQKLKETLQEVFLVSTCNRLAIYAYHDDHQPLLNYFDQFGVLSPYLSILEHEYTVAEHLFSTAAGLKSQALGEHQILGQVRESYYTAQEAGTLGPVLHELAKRSLRAGKRVRGETAIGKAPVSLSSVAFDLINKQYNDLSDARILVIGTGEMATILLKILAKYNPGKVIVASKEKERAEKLGNLLEVTPIAYDEIPESLKNVEAVVGATATNLPIIEKSTIEQIGIQHSLTFIDLAVPRNFAMDLNELEQTSLYDLDRLKDLTNVGIQNRKIEIPKANAIIQEEVDEYEFWLNTNRLNPVITNFYQDLEKIKDEEVEWALPKMGDLDDQQKRVLQKMAHRMMRKVSKNPIRTLKNYAKKPDEKLDEIQTFQEIFNISDVDVNVPKRKIVIGSRGSKLAMAQTNQIVEQLRAFKPEYEFAIKPIKTSGDRGNVNTVGAFVKEVELALLNKEIDLAVHSYKDLPTKLPEGLTIAGIPPREDVRDVFISRDDTRLQDMPHGSVIGTSSLRRAIQITQLNPEAKVKPINGNIITRIEKVKNGEVDGIVIAGIGLQRINIFEKASQVFSIQEMLPAVAQGILAVEVRDEDSELKKIINQLTDPDTAAAVKAERTVLTALGGGCRLPLGAYATIDGDAMTIEGLYGRENGSVINHEKLTGKVEEANEIGKQLVNKISKL